MITEDKHNHRFACRLAAFLSVVGCMLLAAGFIVSPTGEIHSSILVAFGEIMTFVAALLGASSAIIMHYKNLISKIVQENGTIHSKSSDASDSH